MFANVVGAARSEELLSPRALGGDQTPRLKRSGSPGFRDRIHWNKHQWDEKAVGTAGFSHLDEAHRYAAYHIGIWSASARGRGVGTAATRMCVFFRSVPTQPQGPPLASSWRAILLGVPEDGAASPEGRVQRDKWATWLAERRHGGDPEQLRRQLESLAPVRDQVVANAALAPGHRVLDVGCGDGLIAFAAAEAVGPSGLVIFSDISQDLLDGCRALAVARHKLGTTEGRFGQELGTAL